LSDELFDGGIDDVYQIIPDAGGVHTRFDEHFLGCRIKGGHVDIGPYQSQLAISGGPTLIVQEPFGGIQKSGGVGDMVEKDGWYGGQLHKITQTLAGFEEHKPGDVRGGTSRMLRGEREFGQRRCEAAL